MPVNLCASPVDAGHLNSGSWATGCGRGSGSWATVVRVLGDTPSWLRAFWHASRFAAVHQWSRRREPDVVAELGVVADIQPAWLYLDTRTLTAQFGYDRLRYFQPLKSLFEAGALAGGGSDHMQKIGSLRSVNPYNPFLGMWTTITRRAKWYDGQLHPEESLSREQAMRFYTSNNAHILFLEDRVGSLEEGKLADLVILDRDLLTCPVDDIKNTQVVRTYVNGRQVYAGK